MSRRDRPPVVVVGAGAQGLTFALALARRGEPVLVVERSGEVGGQARSFRDDGWTFDFGLHAFVTDDPALTRLAREALGPDFAAFRPRAATSLANAALVEDRSSWCLGGGRRPLYDLLSDGAPQAWNCMRVARPPLVVYPARGGFGRLFERLAAAVRRAGGTVRLNCGADPRGFVVEGGRLVAMTIGGRRVPVAGCYWSAGTALLRPPEREPAGGNAIAFHHFLMRGPAPVPYHWVRLEGVGNPLLPRLVYYPARFSASNAPRGCHGVGAAVPLAPAHSGKAAGVARWAIEEPSTFTPLVLNHLARRGLIDPGAVVSTRTRVLPAPPARSRRSARHPYEAVSNFWDSDRWAPEDSGDSGVPLQMSAALRAAADVLGAAAA